MFHPATGILKGQYSFRCKWQFNSSFTPIHCRGTCSKINDNEETLQRKYLGGREKKTQERKGFSSLFWDLNDWREMFSIMLYMDVTPVDQFPAIHFWGGDDDKGTFTCSFMPTLSFIIPHLSWVPSDSSHKSLQKFVHKYLFSWNVYRKVEK